MDIENMLRIGEVSNTNPSKKTARVIFHDLNNMVSGELHVLQHPRAVVDVEIAEEHSHAVTNETCSSAGSHIHKAAVTIWMPKVGENVLCIYHPISNNDETNSDGYILGVL